MLCRFCCSRVITHGERLAFLPADAAPEFGAQHGVDLADRGRQFGAGRR